MSPITGLYGIVSSASVTGTVGVVDVVVSSATTSTLVGAALIADTRIRRNKLVILQMFVAMASFSQHKV